MSFDLDLFSHYSDDFPDHLWSSYSKNFQQKNVKKYIPVIWYSFHTI